MQAIYSEVQSLGGSIFLIGPETEETALQLMEKTKATIPLLYDRAGAVIESYRLMFELPPFFQQAYASLDLPKANPQTGWKLPIPATYVVGTDGKIAARYINADYTYRMEPADVLAAVKAAAG